MSRIIAVGVMFSAAVAILALVVTSVSAAPAVAPGATFTVTSNADQTGPVLSGTLRWAIQQANATDATDNINFNIPAAQSKTINLIRELPEISKPVIIDGTTQNPSSTTPPITLNGAGAVQGSGDVTGFTIRTTASGTTIRGIVINNFRANGIQILDSNNNTIERNFIGTNSSGTEAESNLSEGVLIGNETATANNNLVQQNLISGNSGSGIHLSGSATNNNVIKNNKIGTDVNGTSDIGNNAYGILLENAPNNTIGGTGVNEGNTIAFNGNTGIQVELRDGILIRRNSIFSNQNLGIQITGFPNSSAPLMSPVGNPPTNNVTVTFTGAANTQYVFEFFNNTECDPSDYGEGQTFLKQEVANSNGSGLVSFTTSVSGANVTATATGGLGTPVDPTFTSEFSPCYTGTSFQTNTPTSTATSTATGTATNTRTASPTNTPITFTVTPTFTSTVTETPGPTDTNTPTPTHTRTPTTTTTPQTPTATKTSGALTSTPTATPCPGGKPGIPNNVSPGNSSSVFVRSVPVAWTQPCAVFYKIMIKEGSKAGPKVQKKKITAPTQQFMTKQLDKGSTYVWHVKACKPGKKNCSKWSPWWKFKVSNSATSFYNRDDWFVAQFLTEDTALLTK